MPTRRRSVYLYSREATSPPARQGDRTEAGCKPLNNSSRCDRWVACRSFLLARSIKSAWVRLELAFTPELRPPPSSPPPSAPYESRQGPRTPTGQRRARWRVPGERESERTRGPGTWPAVNCQHLMSAL